MFAACAAGVAGDEEIAIAINTSIASDEFSGGAIDNTAMNEGLYR